MILRMLFRLLHPGVAPRIDASLPCLLASGGGLTLDRLWATRETKWISLVSLLVLRVEACSG